MQRWPEPLLARMGHGPALNAGIGGDGIPQLLWRLDRIDWNGQKPRNVYVMIGTNDLARRAAGCEVVEGLMAVREKLAAIFPDAKAHIISILPRGPDLHEYESAIELINAELSRRAAKGDYDFMDAAAAFLKSCAPSQQTVSCPYLQGPKNVHPTPAGYELLFNYLQR
jgi:lysophospholipase L1-like esterase